MMKKIEFSSDDVNELVKKLKNYFDKELDYDLGQFDAEFLLDFISKEIGAHYYNVGLKDAQVLVATKLDELDANIDELIQPTYISKY